MKYILSSPCVETDEIYNFKESSVTTKKHEDIWKHVEDFEDSSQKTEAFPQVSINVGYFCYHTFQNAQQIHGVK